MQNRASIELNLIHHPMRYADSWRGNHCHRDGGCSWLVFAEGQSLFALSRPRPGPCSLTRSGFGLPRVTRTTRNLISSVLNLKFVTVCNYSATDINVKLYVNYNAAERNVDYIYNWLAIERNE